MDVVYVHGLWMTGIESLVLRRRLAQDFGLRLHAFRYSPSLSPMSEITSRLESFVRELRAPAVHFLGHSLGGLVIYRLLELHPDQPPGRVVFLGVPSVASRAAERAGANRLLATLMGRSVAEELLRPSERRWVVPRELGIIAGTQPLGTGRFLARFEEECDGTVSVSETRLPGAADHLVLHVSHLGMLVSARVAWQTGWFLTHGRFQRERSGAAEVDL